MIKNKRNSGQSLVEVVMTVSVIVLVLAGLVSAITVGLSNAQFARNKAQATQYAQEAVEWVRSIRDENWTTFYGYSSAGGTTYCTNVLDIVSVTVGTCGANSYINDQFDIFKREVTLTRVSGRVSVAVRVYWQNGARLADVSLSSYLTQWR